jgi:hypothetical protein
MRYYKNVERPTKEVTRACIVFALLFLMLGFVHVAFWLIDTVFILAWLTDVVYKINSIKYRKEYFDVYIKEVKTLKGGRYTCHYTWQNKGSWSTHSIGGTCSFTAETQKKALELAKAEIHQFIKKHASNTPADQTIFIK